MMEENTGKDFLLEERNDAVSLMTSIFEGSHIGVIITDSDDKIIRVNESFVKTYGWSRDDILGVDFMSLVTPDEREKALLGIGVKKSQEGEGNTTGELKFIRKDGAVANVLYTRAVKEFSRGRHFQIITVMDITLRKQMEESLRHAKEQADAANHAKSVFLANMSHELRTPLNAIIGFSEMVMTETFGPLGHDKYKEYLGDVHTSANLLLDIINEVLDMSKIEAGRLELDEDELDVAELLLSVQRMMASRGFSEGISFVKKWQDDLPHVMADGRLLRQVLINLLSNAVKFSEKGGEVTLGAHRLGDGRVQIIVQDQGAGIPKDKVAHAMEPFGQIRDTAENAHQQGTGLGLPLAKAMVELHGGTFDIESDLGQGTSVFVTLPIERVLASCG